jgi:hypothetical protein
MMKNDLSSSVSLKKFVKENFAGRIEDHALA